MSSLKYAARIVSTGNTRLATKTGHSVYSLAHNSLMKALDAVHLQPSHLDGVLTVPSLSEPGFMEAHAAATKMNLFPHPRFYAKTIDVGGAGPVSCLIEAKRLIECGHHLIAILAGDAITSLSPQEFASRAEAGFSESSLESPCIPNGYNKIAEWHINKGYITRKQLAMSTVLMSHQAAKHPDAMTRKPWTLDDILGARSVASVTSLYECARRADGGAAILVASSEFLKKHKISGIHPRIIGGGETSGPLYPPKVITEDLFTCSEAVELALQEAKMDYDSIDFYGLYDCFPICLTKAIEAVKLAPVHQGGNWIEETYNRTVALGRSPTPRELPVNTHGGLMCYGAPWETPAMYGIIEACAQLRGHANDRQIEGARTALVYGNGGIFSASSVVVLARI